MAEIQNTQDNRKLRLEMSVWKALCGLLWCLVFQTGCQRELEKGNNGQICELIKTAVWR